MSKYTLKDVGMLALDFAKAAQNVTRCKHALSNGYIDWREAMGCHDYIEKNSPEWAEMMAATADEYRALAAAKACERRSKAKLLRASAVLQIRLDKAMEGA